MQYLCESGAVRMRVYAPERESWPVSGDPKKNVDTGLFACRALCRPAHIIYAIVTVSFVSVAS